MLDVVVSHQALELKCELVVRLMYALVSPQAEHFRPLLRRLAGLVGQTTSLSWGGGVYGMERVGGYKALEQREGGRPGGGEAD